MEDAVGSVMGALDISRSGLGYGLELVRRAREVLQVCVRCLHYPDCIENIITRFFPRVNRRFMNSVKTGNSTRYQPPSGAGESD